MQLSQEEIASVTRLIREGNEEMPWVHERSQLTQDTGVVHVFRLQLDTNVFVTAQATGGTDGLPLYAFTFRGAHERIMSLLQLLLDRPTEREKEENNE